MKVLIIGNGGREHALALRLHQSPCVKEVHSTPVNVGIQSLGGHCAQIKTTDFDGLYDYVRKQRIDLVVVGPEEPLSKGIADYFIEKRVPVFGPCGRAARIESSKGFAKELMTKYNIPTASFHRFTDADKACRYIKSLNDLPVIKADGLAAGKGVVLPESKAEAISTVTDMISGKYLGQAGASIVIEERLSGPEVSIFAITDGERFATLIPAQDHKRIFDNDQGANTGGMGAYAPVPLVTADMLKTIEDKIIGPAIRGMASEGFPYSGLLYAGLMITAKGPSVIEFNCRFGDPETQVVLPLLQGDLGEILASAASGHLAPAAIRNNTQHALCVVLASRGYPASSEKNIPIYGLEMAGRMDNVLVYHAGTKAENNAVLTNGGRVLGITGLGHTLAEARGNAYLAVDQIRFDGMQYRKDIALKVL